MANPALPIHEAIIGGLPDAFPHIERTAFTFLGQFPTLKHLTALIRSTTVRPNQAAVMMKTPCFHRLSPARH